MEPKPEYKAEPTVIPPGINTTVADYKTEHDGQGPLKPGDTTSEYRQANRIIVTAFVLIIAYMVNNQILTEEQGDLFVQLINLIFPVIGVAVIGWVFANYNRGRVELKKWYAMYVDGDGS